MQHSSVPWHGALQDPSDCQLMASNGDGDAARCIMPIATFKLCDADGCAVGPGVEAAAYLTAPFGHSIPDGVELPSLAEAGPDGRQVISSNMVDYTPNLAMPMPINGGMCCIAAFMTVSFQEMKLSSCCLALCGIWIENCRAL